ncbi:hypothetical protein Rhopal_000608-T1 [Rhodotorula paludigena]|uniref:Nop52-domain-containing protein n=1 Tax=Rhodotorula paludigena TaxID=86838 RepID=A0AAV5GGE9_9BASI|nr:hypothetical protein Rhopal_000608-T1 [Rhodotorula paludigena]
MPSDLGKRALGAADAQPPAKKAKKGAKHGGAPSSSTPPLGKFLASSEKHVRDKAVATLSRFLSAGQVKRASAAQGDEDDEAVEPMEEELPVGELNWDEEWTPDARLAPDEMDKLWKGVWYCFWMSDKPLVQQALAQTLADLTLDSKTHNGRVERFRAALCYLRGFWHTVVREWFGMDKHRLDKFLLLIRRFVHVAFRLLEREGWDARAIAEYNEVLTGPGGPLHVTDPKVLHSIAYHLFDIYLDEIERTCAAHLPSSSDSATSDEPSTSAPERSVPVTPLLAPMCSTLAIAPTSILASRATENVFTPLLEALLPPKPPSRPNKRRKNDLPPPPRPEHPGILALAVEGAGAQSDAAAGEAIAKSVLKRLFDEGGSETTGEVNRRRIYQFVAASGVELE